MTTTTSDTLYDYIKRANQIGVKMTLETILDGAAYKLTIEDKEYLAEEVEDFNGLILGDTYCCMEEAIDGIDEVDERLWNNDTQSYNLTMK